MILKGIKAKGIVANEANAIRQSKIDKKINIPRGTTVFPVASGIKCAKGGSIDST